MENNNKPLNVRLRGDAKKNVSKPAVSTVKKVSKNGKNKDYPSL